MPSDTSLEEANVIYTEFSASTYTISLSTELPVKGNMSMHRTPKIEHHLSIGYVEAETVLHFQINLGDNDAGKTSAKLYMILQRAALRSADELTNLLEMQYSCFHQIDDELSALERALSDIAQTA